jgi:hypothetical protein
MCSNRMQEIDKSLEKQKHVLWQIISKSTIKCSLHAAVSKLIA